MIPHRTQTPEFKFAAELRAQLLEGMEDTNIDLGIPTPRQFSPPVPRIEITAAEPNDLEMNMGELTEPPVENPCKPFPPCRPAPSPHTAPVLLEDAPVLKSHMRWPEKHGVEHNRPLPRPEKPKVKSMWKLAPTVPQVSPIPVADPAAKKQWCCMHCLKNFTHEWSLRGHLNTSGCGGASKPHKCARCKKGFNSEWGLEQHVKMHDGI